MVEKSGRYRLGVVVNLGFVGNCCTHGEFVAASLKSEPGAELVAGWESDTMHQLGLVAAMGMALAPRGAAPDSGAHIAAEGTKVLMGQPTVRT